MNEILCTMVEVTVQYAYQKGDVSKWHFDTFDNAVAFCEKEVEKHRNDPESRVLFYAVDEQQFRHCNGDNPGQLYIGISRSTAKFEPDFNYDQDQSA